MPFDDFETEITCEEEYEDWNEKDWEAWYNEEMKEFSDISDDLDFDDEENDD